ncbi:hypothetical protein [Chlorogloeopsis sp. ULAP02]|uniref:hypothetical protein n=1 Tax=Chlorogloeopsis sp. ULAP02 TaxID=3107926 RepID=UPI0031358C41
MREKIVKAYTKDNSSQGHVEPRQQGGVMKGELDGNEAQLSAMVEQYPDATLAEYSEYWGQIIIIGSVKVRCASCIAKTKTYTKKRR